MKYKYNPCFSIDVGFEVDISHVEEAIDHTNSTLKGLPPTVYRSFDLKLLSGSVGAFFCTELADKIGVNVMVNPAEHGHPDIIPWVADDTPDKLLRNYPVGLEVKCTMGNIEPGARLKAGQTRIDKVKDITWKAHHKDVERMLGIVFDFVDDGKAFRYPHITGVFFSDDLNVKDWGKMAGQTGGRNTNVTNMNASGKIKMGTGWVALMDDRTYINRYQELLKFDHRYNDFFD